MGRDLLPVDNAVEQEEEEGTQSLLVVQHMVLRLRYLMLEFWHLWHHLASSYS